MPALTKSRTMAKKRAATAKYEFTVILKGRIRLTEDVADALFAAGCSDGTPTTCNGIFSIDFHRQAGSLEEAIRSAMAAVKSAGFDVARVEIEPDAMRQPA